RTTGITWIPPPLLWYRRFEESFGPFWRLHLENVGIYLDDAVMLIHRYGTNVEIPFTSGFPTVIDNGSNPSV
ncbi:MAG: hypothetical protein O7G32_06870, partial [SAR324 cluster bacterium]|nr:hypothetical protein [SAR324 cluster bacterium]